MRLLFLSADKFPPFRPDVTVLFGKELTGRGHAIDWLLQSEKPCDAAYWTEWQGGRAWVGKTDTGTTRWQRVRKNALSFLHDLRLFRLLGQEPYDFLVVKDKVLEAIPALFASYWSATPIVYWLSYPFPEGYLELAEEGTARYPLLYWLRGHIFFILLYRVLLPRMQHIFVQSEQMRRDLVSYGLEAERMTPVPMGVQLEEIPFFGYNAQPAEGAGSLVYLGTLTKVRKLDFLIRVLALVLPRHPQAHLTFVGGGEDKSDEQLLWAEAKRLGVAEQMTITGFLPREEAWRRMATATVCLSPYYPTPVLNSTSPTKLIEYMAMGKAVVANDHPEQRLVLDASGGGVVVPWDEGQFSTAIISLLDRPQELAEMGRRGRVYVERFRSYGRIASLVETKLLDILSALQGGPL